MKKSTQTKLRSLIERIIREEIIPPYIDGLISDIVKYYTLPAQIDYKRPYKIKADSALSKLENMANGDKYIKIAHKRISDKMNNQPPENEF